MNKIKTFVVNKKKTHILNRVTVYFYFIFEWVKLSCFPQKIILKKLRAHSLCQTVIRFALYRQRLVATHTPFRYFSAYEYSVIGLPDTPHVPMPTRPFTFSGDAKILLILTAFDFFVLFDLKFSHLFLSCSRSSSSSLKRCNFFCFFFFRYSLLLGRWRLKEDNDFDQCRFLGSQIFFTAFLRNYKYFTRIS